MKLLLILALLSPFSIPSQTGPYECKKIYELYKKEYRDFYDDMGDVQTFWCRENNKCYTEKNDELIEVDILKCEKREVED